MQNKVVYGLYFALKSIDLDQYVSKIFVTKTGHKNTKWKINVKKSFSVYLFSADKTDQIWY